MPKVYRSMKPDQDGLPELGQTARSLGIRPPPGDVDLDDQGRVILNGRGMSVARGWRDLPAHRIPRRLDDGKLGAIGKDGDACWCVGDGPFAAGPFDATLAVALKGDPQRGNLTPSQPILLSEFETALANTRAHWTVDEG
jgi:hypothetical protein